MRSSLILMLIITFGLTYTDAAVGAHRPNVLVVISDDQSYPHASAYGDPVVQTPGFDRVAKEGLLFSRAFTPCPGCSPMRAAFLTGQHVWQIREAGTHASHFPKDLRCFTGQLQQAGYATGYTGKPWGPGRYEVSGWKQNPVGPAFNALKNKAPQGISSTDYASNFEHFLDTVAEEQSDEPQPFCFWFGGHEPHRSFGNGLGRKAGMDLSAVRVPSFLPDSETVRSDLADYFFEIQWHDSHLERMLDTLHARGMLDNTIVIVTSDNGMSFPRAKANLYEYGIHMPLAIRWPGGIDQPGRTVDQLVSLLDVTATIYDVCGVSPPDGQPLSGKSLRDLFTEKPSVERTQVFAGRERHSSSRYNSLGYPCRCVRTDTYLYIRNFFPERWPAGTPQKYDSAVYDEGGNLVSGTLGKPDGGYHDIDACPTLDWMIANRSTSSVAHLLDLAVAHRPAEELYRVASDPGCLQNLTGDSQHADALALHRKLLAEELTRTGDLRFTDPTRGHVWETYPRYSGLRWFPEPKWAAEGEAVVPQQPWLDARRPRPR